MDLKNKLFENQPLTAKILGGNDFATVISTLLPNIMIIAGIIFFLLILGSGFMMIKNSGGEHNPQDAAKAKNAVTFSTIGFLLIVSAYFILQIVGTILGVDFTNNFTNL